jgi:hypothetical protein
MDEVFLRAAYYVFLIFSFGLLLAVLNGSWSLIVESKKWKELRNSSRPIRLKYRSEIGGLIPSGKIRQIYEQKLLLQITRIAHPLARNLSAKSRLWFTKSASIFDQLTSATGRTALLIRDNYFKKVPKIYQVIFAVGNILGESVRKMLH